MGRFVMRTDCECSAQELFRWHMQPGAFERLCPPWIKVRVLKQEGTIAENGTVLIEIIDGLVKFRWHLAHDKFIENQQFSDYQISGPFKKWRHLHKFLGEGKSSVLVDEIEYELPILGVFGVFAEPFVNLKLAQLFKFRHEVTYKSTKNIAQ